MFRLHLLKKAFLKGHIEWRRHALEKMAERAISKRAVANVIETGEVIEEYLSSKPYPSCLILGLDAKRPIHVVAAIDEKAGKAFIITTYEPTVQEFGPDFKNRRKS